MCKRKSVPKETSIAKKQRTVDNYTCVLHDNNKSICQIYMCAGCNQINETNQNSYYN